MLIAHRLRPVASVGIVHLLSKGTIMAAKVTNLLRGVIDQPFAADALIGPHLSAEEVDGWRLLQVEAYEGGWRFYWTKEK